MPVHYVDTQTHYIQYSDGAHSSTPSLCLYITWIPRQKHVHSSPKDTKEVVAADKWCLARGIWNRETGDATLHVSITKKRGLFLGCWSFVSTASHNEGKVLGEIRKKRRRSGKKKTRRSGKKKRRRSGKKKRRRRTRKGRNLLFVG